MNTNSHEFLLQRKMVQQVLRGDITWPTGKDKGRKQSSARPRMRAEEKEISKSVSSKDIFRFCPQFFQILHPVGFQRIFGTY